MVKWREMSLLRKVFKATEVLTVVALAVMVGIILTGNFHYDHLKFFLSALSLFISLFVFLVLYDDSGVPMARFFNLVGWLSLFTGVIIILMIQEVIHMETYWSWLNSFLLAGLFSAQASELNQMRRVNSLLKYTHVLLSLLGFILLVFAVFGNPFNFTLLFTILGFQLVVAIIILFTGKRN